MRHISISLILTAACICCIQSCKTEISTDVLNTSATYPLSDKTDAKLELKIDVEYIISGPGAAAVRNINSAIILGLFGEKYGEMDIQEAVSAYSAAVSAEYREANRPLLEDSLFSSPAAMLDSLFSSPAAMLNWSDWTQGAVSGTHGNILSYTVTKYTYTGGAHGMTSETTLNFDTDNGSLIGETELFQDGYEERLSTLLSLHLPEALQEPGDTAMLFTRDIRPNGNFKVSEAGVTYIYNQYEIGPYVLGAVEVTVPWEELKDLLR